MNKFKKEHEYGNYNAYDGTNHNTYNVENDETISNLTQEELIQHYRIIGYNPNKLPEHINKLIGNK